MARRLHDRRRRVGGRAIEIAGRPRRCRGRAALRCSNRSTCERCELAEACADRASPTSRPCCASSRRRSSARSSAGIGDFDAAEDAVQEALLAAAEHWPHDGIPAGAARLADPDSRAAADRPLAERASRKHRETARGPAEPPGLEVSAEDDTLTVLFMCCHPALTPASAIALTLRAVGGLTTAEIARAFLVDEATMAQRICGRSSASRRPAFRSGCRRRGAAGQHAERPPRPLPDLQRGLREQHGARAARAELSDEAIRLTRMVHRLLPDDGEVTGPARAHAADRRATARANRRRRAS